MVLAFLSCPEKDVCLFPKTGSRPLRFRQGQLAAGARDVAEVDQEQAEVEANRLGMREPARKRPEPGKGGGRALLAVQPDGRGGQRLGIVGGTARRGGERPFGRDGPQRLLVRRAAEEVDLSRRSRAGEAGREGRQAGRR